MNTSILPPPLEILSTLLKFDTTNPPGNEYDCIYYIKGLLESFGIEAELLAKDPRRPNLIARICGQGTAPPLMMHGHVDVVSTSKQDWTHPPFSAHDDGEYIWGRGTLDMKGAVAMMIWSFLHLVKTQTTPPGDVILVVLSDEEHGGIFGAKYIVEEYPEKLSHIDYAIGEVGGFSMDISGKRFYPIMIAEKQICWLKAIIRGDGGHGSLIHRNGTMARVGNLLSKLNRLRLPIHITKEASLMIDGISMHVPFPTNSVLQQLKTPVINNILLKLLEKRLALFEPSLRTTINATILTGGDKINVIPSEVEVQLDARLLPRQNPEDLLSVLQAIDPCITWEPIVIDPPHTTSKLELFPQLVSTIKEMDSDGIPVPYLMAGVTDGRFFNQLGIQTYGFTPMRLPMGFSASKLIHSADERIPRNAIEFGSHTIYKLLTTLKMP